MLTPTTIRPVDEPDPLSDASMVILQTVLALAAAGAALLLALVR